MLIVFNCCLFFDTHNQLKLNTIIYTNIKNELNTIILLQIIFSSGVIIMNIPPKLNTLTVLN